MASASFTLPKHVELDSNVITWFDDLVGLGDASALRADTNPAWLTRLVLHGDQADSANEAEIRLEPFLPLLELWEFLPGLELTSAWQIARAVQITATGLNTLTIMGPDGSTGEAYTWTPGAARALYVGADGVEAGLAQWVADFKAAYASDDSLRATVTLDDTPNSAPVVSVVADLMEVSADGAVTLDGTATDVDGDTLTYSWVSDGGGVFADAAALDTSWTAPSVTAETDIVLTITVSDGVDSAMASVTVTVVVLDDADAPTLTVTKSGDVDESGSATVTASISGGTYDTVSYAWSDSGFGGTFGDSTAASTTWTAPAVDSTSSATITCAVTVNGTGTVAFDGTSDSVAGGVSVQVRNVPVVTTDTDSIYILSADAPTTPTGGASDEDFLPTGWARTEPTVTATQSVWRSQRIRTYSDGDFQSAGAWGAPVRFAHHNLLLSDYVATAGYATELVGLIEVDTANANRYWAGNNGTLVDGELELDNAAATINRIRDPANAGTRVRINQSGSDSLSGLFISGDEYDDAIWDFQGLDGSFSVGVTEVSTAGTGVDYTIADSDGRTWWSGLETGHRILIALRRPVSDIQIQSSIAIGVPSVSARIRTVPPPVRVRSGIESGMPAVTAKLQITPPPAQLQSDVQSGVPSVSARVRTIPPPVRVRSPIVAGIPSVFTQVRSSVPGPVRIRSDVSSGVPSVTAEVRVAPEMQVQSAILFGVPVVTARLRTQFQGEAKVQASMEFGVPVVSTRVRTTSQPTINSIAAQNSEVVRMLVTAGSTSRIYSRRGDTVGSVSSDSDLEVEVGVNVDRVQINAGSNWVRIFLDSDASSVFGVGEVGENANLYLATPYGSVDLLDVDNVRSTSGEWTITVDQASILGQIQVGDMVNVVLAGFTIQDAQVQADIDSGAPSVIVRVRTIPPPVRVQSDVQAGVPTIGSRLRTEALGEAQIQVSIETGVPAVAFQVRADSPGESQVQSSIRAGVPELTTRVRGQLPTAAQIQSAIESGVPAVAVQVRSAVALTLATPDAPTVSGADVRVALVVQVVTTASGQTLRANVTGMRLVEWDQLLESEERGVVGFSKVG